MSSAVSEDPVHSKNTLKWLLKFDPDADEALQIAALGHDIERAVEERKVRRKDYESYDEFKKAHALKSAEILREIMDECRSSRKLTEDVYNLICLHERGGHNRANLLRDADSISFFDVNLSFYFTRNGVEETKERYLWGYRKLSDSLKAIVADFNYEDKELDSLVKSWIADFNST
ncbi:MAG: DUF4202 family protein [Proteobacteria bacterium]|nr:DUF4202 family protein [Pseudomonadota bacterium]